MSTATVITITVGADFAFASVVAAGTYLAAKVIDRLPGAARTRSRGRESTPAERGGYTAGPVDVSELPMPPVPMTVAARLPLSPRAAERQAAYDWRRDDGATPAGAAEALGITARTTARDYETRYQASVAARGAS